MTRRFRPGDAAISASIFLLAFTFLYLFRRLGWMLQDDGVLYYQYLRVYQGQLPYRDFFTGYGPLGYYVNAWAFALFGISINAIRVLTAIVNATTAVGLYCVTRRLAPRGFALIPPALFLVMQPGDIRNFVFHNSPYPSWYAIAFAVWGTWSMLRFLESTTNDRRNAWVVLTGVLGGLVFLSKQNAGIFFLWGVTGFLASSPEHELADDETEPWLARGLRAGYLALIPLAALGLVKRFVGPATLCCFVLPAAALAALGARRRFGAAARRTLLWRVGALSVGVAAALSPWLAYFAVEMGLLSFLRAILFAGSEVDRISTSRSPDPGRLRWWWSCRWRRGRWSRASLVGGPRGASRQRRCRARAGARPSA